MKKTMKLLVFFLMFLYVGETYAQSNIPPAVMEVSSETFVLVIKKIDRDNLKIGERVVMSDFTASDKDFDPNKIKSYPKWKLKPVNIINKDSYDRYIALHCLDNDKYYHRKKGMLDAKEYDKFFEKDDTGNYKIKDRDDLFNFLFYPEIKDTEYIQLKYEKDESLVLTPGAWKHQRQIKLVLFRYK
ncbi:MAG: hypothetical protein U9Q83_04980 [Bacteroidota bacterium]|nr:hypothetical protein [Bacteroidota bacterium]